MKNTILIENKKKNWNKFDIVLLVSVFIICNIATFFEIAPTSWDETGYFLQAAYMAGEDWSDVSTILPYYSFGNALLTSLLFRLFRHIIHYSILYKMVLVEQSFFLCLSFVIARKAYMLLFNPNNSKIASLVALVCILYPSNIAYSDLHLSETYITFSFWAMVLLLIEMNQKGVVFFKVILYDILIVYIFFVHQRMLGVSICGFIVLIAFLIKAIHNKTINKRIIVFSLVSAIIVLCLFVTGYIYKNHSKTALWPVESSLNDFNAYVELVDSRFYWLKAFVGVLADMLRKIWYVNLTTFGFLLIALIEIIKGFFIKNQGEKNNSLCITNVFLVASLLASLGIVGIVAAEGKYVRIDNIFLGRYIEAIIGPYLLIGMGQFINNKKRYNIGIIIIVNVLLLKNVEYAIHYTLAVSDSVSRSSNVGLYIFLSDSYKVGTVELCVLIVSLLEVFIWLLSKNNKGIICSLAVVLVFFIINTVAFTNSIVEGQIINKNELARIVDYIGEGEQSIGYFKGQQMPLIVKFMNPDLHFSELKTDLDFVEEKQFDFIILEKKYINSFDIIDLNSYYKTVYELDKYIMLEKVRESVYASD